MPISTMKAAAIIIFVMVLVAITKQVAMVALYLGIEHSYLLGLYRQR